MKYTDPHSGARTSTRTLVAQVGEIELSPKKSSLTLIKPTMIDAIRRNFESSGGFNFAARVIQNKSALLQCNQYYGESESLIPLMYGLDWINTLAFAIRERASE